jgi:hypothetical protein
VLFSSFQRRTWGDTLLVSLLSVCIKVVSFFVVLDMYFFFSYYALYVGGLYGLLGVRFRHSDGRVLD